jgi:hypothetical protein
MLVADFLLVLILVCGGAGMSGCGSGPTADEAPGQMDGRSSSTFSPMMKAYFEAHPDLVDGPLRPAPKPAEQIVADLRAGLDWAENIWLPDYLPHGFALAAPYNGSGSGAAYPNPYAIGNAYSVTYTDGAGYIMVMKNSQDDLSERDWTPLAETFAGRHLRLHRDADVTLVATTEDGEETLLVAGAGFAGEQLSTELIRVAASLSLH